MNAVVKSYGGFGVCMPWAEAAAVDCGGLIILPLAEPEHGLGFGAEAHSGVFNLTADNCLPGNLVRASFVGSMFSLLWSVQAMRKQNIFAKEFVVSGGIVQSDWIAQVIADVFDTPVRTFAGAAEGSAYGAALMAIYGVRKQTEPDLTWSKFLGEMRPTESRFFPPIRENVATYFNMFGAFCQLVDRVAGELNSVPWVA